MTELQRRAREVYSQNNIANNPEESEVDRIIKKYGLKADEETASNGYMGAFKDSADVGFAGVVSGITQYFGATDTAKHWEEIAQRNQDTKNFDSIFSWDYLTDPRGLTSTVGNQVGSMAALAPVGALVSATLPASVPAAASGVLGSMLTRMGAKKAAQYIASPAGQSLIRTAMAGGSTAVPEGLSEEGQVINEALRRGYSLEDARKIAEGVATRNIPLLISTNALEWIILSGKFGNPAGKAGETLMQRAFKAPLRVAPPVAVGSAQNATEELLQETIQAKALGDTAGNPFVPSTWTEAQHRSFQEGLAGSFILGGVTSGARAMGSDAQRSRQVYDSEVGTDDSANAELIAENQQLPQPVRFNPLPVSDGVEDWDGVDDTTKNATYAFGQTLKDKYGIDPLITSGKRSAENNTAVNGSPTSHHLYGKAADVYLGEISDEMAEQVKADAIVAGWGEVLFHDAGTGKHLHLADFQGDINNFGGATGVDTGVNSQPSNEVFSYDEGNSSRDSDLMQARNFLESNSYLDYEDSGSAIFSTLEENDPNKIIAKAEELGWVKKENAPVENEQSAEQILENILSNPQLAEARDVASTMELGEIRNPRKFANMNIKGIPSRAKLSGSALQNLSEAVAQSQESLASFPKLSQEQKDERARKQKLKAKVLGEGFLPDEYYRDTESFRQKQAMLNAKEDEQYNAYKDLFTKADLMSEKIKSALENEELNNLARKSILGDKNSQALLNKVFPEARKALFEKAKSETKVLGEGFLPDEYYRDQKAFLEQQSHGPESIPWTQKVKNSYLILMLHTPFVLE